MGKTTSAKIVSGRGFALNGERVYKRGSVKKKRWQKGGEKKGPIIGFRERKKRQRKKPERGGWQLVYGEKVPVQEGGAGKERKAKKKLVKGLCPVMTKKFKKTQRGEDREQPGPFTLKMKTWQCLLKDGEGVVGRRGKKNKMGGKEMTSEW